MKIENNGKEIVEGGLGDCHVEFTKEMDNITVRVNNTVIDIGKMTGEDGWAIVNVYPYEREKGYKMNITADGYQPKTYRN